MSAHGAVVCRQPVSGRRSGLLSQTVLALVTAGYLTGAVLGWGSPRLALAMGDFGRAAAALTAAVSCFWYARTVSSPFSSAWRLFAFSSAMVGVGDAVWGWYEIVLGRPMPSSSPAGLCFLLFAPSAIVGVLVLAKRPVTRAGWTCLILDAWLIGGSLLTIAWSLALAHPAGGGRNVAHAALALVYPLLDIVLISMVLALHFRCSVGNRAVINTAVAGLALSVLSDALSTSPLVREHYSSGGLLDAGWFTGSILLAYAPWAGRRGSGRPDRLAGEAERAVRTRRPIAGSLAALAPYLAAAVCTLGVLYSIVKGRVPDRVVIFTACTVVLALVVRQGIMLLDNIALTQELAQKENHFRSLVQSSSDVIMIAASNGVLRYVSPAAAGVYGIDPEELVGSELSSLIHPEDLGGVAHEVRRFLAADPDDEPATRIECRFRAGSGRLGGNKWLNVESTVNRHHGGLILNSRDVTERVRLQAQLRHNAEHDPLTDLPNRGVFIERVRQALGGRRSTDPGTAVLFIDLDGFKAVNDTIGHQAGDELLVQASRRLQESVRAGDTAARLGGDEFAALVLGDGSRDPVARERHILEVANRLRIRLSRPYRVLGTEVRVAASIGVAFAEPGTTPAELMRRADSAMYRAKAAGKARVELYTPQTPGETAPGAGTADPATLPSSAPAEGEFTLVHQPVVALEGGRIAAVSAYARWRSRQGILFTSAELLRACGGDRGRQVPFAPGSDGWDARVAGGEEPDRRLLEEAVRQAAERHRAGQAVPVVVRLSPRLLMDPGTGQRHVMALLARHGLPPGALVLELSGGDPRMPLDELEQSMAALRRLGVRFVLDGIGSTDGALYALRRLPVDGLKLDRGLVGGVLDSTRLHKIAAGLLRIAGDLGLQSVADGVDRPEQAAVLRAMGCTHGQGRAFSGPLDDHRLRLTLTRGEYQVPGVPEPRDGDRDTVVTSPAPRLRRDGAVHGGAAGHPPLRSNNETSVPPT